MRIGIYSNPEKDRGYEVAARLAGIVLAAGSEPIVNYKYQNTSMTTIEGLVVSDYNTCDIIICLGGDGTFLSAVHLPDCQHIPMIGVNLGSIGFLPEIAPDQLEAAIDQIVTGNFRIEKRMMLDVTCLNHHDEILERGLALNDVVVTRGRHSRILTLDLHINKVAVERIPGDGIIVSTPTGSTAYSLSAGGPIVHPSLSLLVMTPISPHTLHNRSYLADDKSEVVIRVMPYPFKPLVAIDGRQEIEVPSGAKIIVRRAHNDFLLIKLNEDQFFATIPHKIHARGKVSDET